MCDFLSWKKSSDGHVFFLTDNEVFSPHGRKTLTGTIHNDVLGHGAIDAFYGNAATNLSQFEYKCFWNKSNFPPEIAVHLESPETLLNTWGKMLRQYLQPDDALYILIHAPEPWRAALFDICFKHVVKDAKCAYNTLCEIKGLTKAQKDVLIKRAAQYAKYAYDTLCNVKGLTKEQKDILVRGVAEHAGYAYNTLCEIKGLTKAQRALLRKRNQR